jgi:hypothetical protein
MPLNKQQILAEARCTLARDWRKVGERAVAPPSAPAELVLPPLETLHQRHRRELMEQDRQWAAERRAREREERRQMPQPITYADIDARIAAALRAERTAVVPTLRACIDELLEAERMHIKNEAAQTSARLELSIAKLESALSALQVALVAERGKAIDLPNPLTRVN